MAQIHIQDYLDSTYLKTPEQSGLSEAETQNKVKELVQECIDEGFVLAMIRPDYVAMAKKMVQEAKSKVFIGTVIGFHEGINTTLGLPFVRTSPDHGTALELAGTGNANPSSFVAALKQADRMSSSSQLAGNSEPPDLS